MKTKQPFWLVAVAAVLVGVAIWNPLGVWTAHASNLSTTAVYTLQVTIGASCTQVTSSDIPLKQVFFQNNATHSMRIGDANASSTRGVALASNGSLTVGD